MKNIVITGGGQGIGYYLTKQLLADGYSVTVLDLDINGLLALSEEHPSLLPLTCDVRSLEEMKLAVETSVRKFGSVDCAVHNACRCTFAPMEDTAEEVYREVLDVNYFGALHLAQAVLPYMKRQHSGRIIFTSSGVGVTGFGSISPYASSKGAIESLAKCLNIEYGKDGISFHLFHPPLTRTQSAAPLPVPREMMASPEKVGTGLAKHINGKRFVLCHNSVQKLQVMLCYLFPVKLGKQMNRMLAGVQAGTQSGEL